eukprot:1158369-Pelagomonas_calceolata.AAC.13
MHAAVPACWRRYDKSANGGRGDRADPSTWPKVNGPVDIVLFEGWMSGFSPLPEEEGIRAKPLDGLPGLKYCHCLLVPVVLQDQASSLVLASCIGNLRPGQESRPKSGWRECVLESLPACVGRDGGLVAGHPDWRSSGVLDKWHAPACVPSLWDWGVYVCVCTRAHTQLARSNANVNAMSCVSGKARENLDL